MAMMGSIDVVFTNSSQMDSTLEGLLADAQKDADTANALIAEIAADNKLTAVEKKITKKEWDIIVSEKPTLDAQVLNYGINETDYTNAYSALNTYITPLLSDLSTTSNIDGTTFRQKFKDYYDQRTTLLKAITDKAKLLADNAQDSADAANNMLDVIADDNKLSPAEKQAVKREWDGIVAEESTIVSQADTYSITTEKNDYINAYNSLSSYITPLLSDLTTTSDIVGTTFRSYFTTYYNKCTILQKKITDIAKSLADSAQDTANSAQNAADAAKSAADAAVLASSAAQSAANTAQNAAIAAQTTANGKNRIFRQSTQPTGTLVSGDIWFDTANDNRVSVYNGSSWTLSKFGNMAISYIDAASITTGYLAAERIASKSIDASKIVTGSLTSASGVFGDISAASITTGYLATERIATGSIDSTKISVTSLSALSADLGTVTAGTINGVTINGSDFNAIGSLGRVKVSGDGWYVMDANGIRRVAIAIAPSDWATGSPSAINFFDNYGYQIGYVGIGGDATNHNMQLNNAYDLTLTCGGTLKLSGANGISILNGINNDIDMSNHSLYNIYGLYATFLYGNAVDINGGTHLYIRPSSGGEVRCTSTGSTTNYVPLHASNVSTSSLEEYKQDIELWSGMALDIINNSDIYQYRLKTDVAIGRDKLEHGLVIGDGYRTPAEVLNNDADGVEQYEMNSISWKAIQELSQQNQNLISKVANLENRLSALEAA